MSRRTYRRDWLSPDVLAGLAVWAVMVPESIAYAGIVGVPPIMGLYTIVPPLVAYALLGTSRLLVVGPDTATGLISALTVGAIAVQGTVGFNTLTSTLAILIGAFFLLFGALRMGWVAAFIPTPVMRGFIEGLVCVTIIGQVPPRTAVRSAINGSRPGNASEAGVGDRKKAGRGRGPPDHLLQPLRLLLAAAGKGLDDDGSTVSSTIGAWRTSGSTNKWLDGDEDIPLNLRPITSRRRSRRRRGPRHPTLLLFRRGGGERP